MKNYIRIKIKGKKVQYRVTKNAVLIFFSRDKQFVVPKQEVFKSSVPSYLDLFDIDDVILDHHIVTYIKKNNL